MDFAGLVGKYRANRPLTESERAYHLRQNQRLKVEPHYQLSVIKMNSTYLESVDKWYGEKGMITAIALIIVAIFIGTLGSVSLDWLLKGFGLVQSSANSDFFLANGIGMAVLVATICCGAVWLLRVESFAYTHYPMRFNRKTRMVHVFRTNGTVLSAPWDKVYFTVAQVDQFHNYWNVMGHILAEDSSTIRESFALSISETGAPDGMLMMQAHWEFVRRYMEDGPESISGQVQFCLPISERRETLTMGVHRLLANNSSSSPIMWPMLFISIIFDVLTVPFRFFAMRTSKVPQWPKEVDIACAIESDDIYAIEGAPNGDRVAVFPEVARAAGVGFRAPPSNPLDMKKQVDTSAGFRRGIAKTATPKANNKKKGNSRSSSGS